MGSAGGQWRIQPMGGQAVRMKVLLFGANGQVGWELQRALSPLGVLSIHDRQTADFENPVVLKTLVEQERPDVIVNAVAYTAVDQAETDQGRANMVNAKAVAALAESAKHVDAWLVHYSTDYVFDGNKQGWYCEDDETNPLSVYGKTKREGELAIIASGCKHLIFRTSWVYAARGNNFAKTMIRLAKERDELKVVADQIGAPTSAELIADVTALALFKLLKSSSPDMPESPPGYSERSRGISSFPRRQESSESDYVNDDISGIYHLTAGGEISWHGFAKHVIAHAQKLGMKLKVESEDIEPITTDQFPRPAKRPQNSKMDTQKLQSLLDIQLPDWRFHVDRIVTEFIESQS